jgi:hypothetical protein
MVTAATLATAAAVFGFSGAAEAADSSQFTNICIGSGIENGVATNCMWSQGAGKAIRLAPQAASVTNWFAPVFGQIGQLKQAHTNLCMEATDVSNAFVLIEATCGTGSNFEFSIRVEADNQVDIESRLNTDDCLSDVGHAGFALVLAGCNETADQAVIFP